jgi:uncharacterized YccA/Bax inhibitor family protein
MHAMRTTNPALNEKVFERELVNRRSGQPAQGDLDPGWAAAQEAYQQPSYAPPGHRDDVMTLSGVVWSAMALLVLVVGAGAFGWSAVTTSEAAGTQMPGWLFVAFFAGFGVAILTVFKPHLARFTSPVYALLMGAAVGAISRVYHEAYEGIVVQAVGLTIGIFAMMLFLYATRVIRVTEKLRMGIVAATGAILLVYVASWILRIFGAEMPFIHESGPLGIGISLVIVGVASFNLLLDFDLIETGVARGLPRHMEWFCAFGLLVTLIWLYLELLRLLAKLQRR